MVEASYIQCHLKKGGRLYICSPPSRLHHKKLLFNLSLYRLITLNYLMLPLFNLVLIVFLLGTNCFPTWYIITRAHKTIYFICKQYWDNKTGLQLPSVA